MGSLREILGNASLVSAGNIAVSGINFVTFLVMWNALGAFGYGLYTLAISVLSFATFFLDAGFSKVIVSDVSKELGEKNEKKAAGLFQGYAIAIMALVSLAGITAFVFSDFIASWMGADIALLVKLIAGLVVLSGAKNILSTSFEIKSAFVKYAGFRFSEAFGKLVIIYAMFSFLGAGVENALYAILVSEIILVALFVFAVPKAVKKIAFFAGARKRDFIDTIRAHGKWAAVFSQARSIESNISYWIVEFFLGVEMVGIFSGLMKIQNLAIRVFEPLETIFYPFIGKLANAKDSIRTVFRAAKFTLMLATPIIGLLVLFPEPLIGAVLGEEMIVHANILRVLLLTVLVVIINTPMKPVFFSIRAQKTLSVISIIYLFITIATASVFTFAFGILGTAFTRVLSPAIDVLLKIFFLRKKDAELCPLDELFLLKKEDVELIKGVLKEPRKILGAGKD